MGHGIINKMLGIDRIVDILLSQLRPAYGQKENTLQSTCALRPVPEADMQLFRYLMSCLSRTSTKEELDSVNKDIGLFFYYEGKSGVDASQLKREYHLRRLGLPYFHPNLHGS